MKLWCSGLSILAMKIVIRIRKSSSLHTLTHTLTRMGNNKNNGIYQRNDMKKRCFSLFPVVKKNEKQRFRLCKKISVNSTTVIKNDIVGRLEKQPLNFFTVYNKYRNLSSFFNGQPVEVHNFQFSQNSAPVSQRYCLKISGDRCFGKAGICCNICKGYIFFAIFHSPCFSLHYSTQRFLNQ